MTGPTTVVPRQAGEHATDAEVIDFRESVLRAKWFWRTRLGEWLLKKFWKSRLGRWVTRRFGNAKPPELHGYAYWGPVALAITVTEILGALSKTFRNAIPWPTISGTVGHVQDLDGRWGLAVVAVIAATAFYAVSYGGEAKPTGTKPVLKVWFIRVRYGWPLVFIATAAIALIVRLAVRHEDATDRKFHLAYAIYGSFAVIGIALPMLLVWRESDRVVFPGLFYTFKKLRERLRWVAIAVIAGLAILVIHLALYPWPNLAREPASYAGVNAFHARVKAVKALREADNPKAKSNLVYSTQGRGISEGHNAWFIYFNLATGRNSTYIGCVVEVTSEKATPTDPCLNK